MDRILAGGGDDIIYANADVKEVDGGGGDDIIYGEPPEIERGIAPNDEGKNDLPGTPSGPVYERAAGGLRTYRFDVPRRRDNSRATTSAVVECESSPCYGGIGSQKLLGGSGNDTIFGQRGNDTIYGNEGHDALFGGVGDEPLISGGKGEDLISGGPGLDVINGNQDGDLVRGDTTIDVIRDTGEAGFDTISFATAVAPGFDGGVSQEGFPGESDTEERGVRVRLDGGEVCAGPGGPLQACNGAAGYGGGNDEIQVIEGNGFENVIGSPFADVIEGDGHANRLEGGGGADVLIGNGGDDILVGGADGDYMEGNDGSDTAFGEKGVNRCAADIENPNQCGGTEQTVVQRDRSKISAGLMTTPGFASSVHWSEAYLVGSNTSRDNVQAAFSYEGGQYHVKFTAVEGSFDESEDVETTGCTYSPTVVDCAMSTPPDVVLMAGMGGNDKLSVGGSGLPETTSVVLLGGEGNDELKGSGTTEDIIIDGTGGGADALEGYSYDDFLTNNSGADSIQGGAGNDLILSTNTCGGDTLNGATNGGDDGAAQNSTSWAKMPSPSGVVADIEQGSAGDIWSGGPACTTGSAASLVHIDDLEGSNQSDALYGDGKDNNLLGRSGEDGIWGRGGEDRIEAKDSQADAIGAGGGADKCYWDIGVDAHDGCDVETKTYISDAERVLAGQPGYVSAHGFVKFVPTDTSNEKVISGAKVYVNFSKWNGSGWEYKWHVSDYSDESGRYEIKDQSLTPGKWRIKGVIYPQGSYLQSESGWHVFTVMKGYRLRPKHSNKCMSASENKRENGTAVIQWDCSGTPNPTDGQVFTLVPVGNHFNILVNQSSACVDVSGAETKDGAKLQLWGCLGPSQTNQIWQRIGIEGDSPYVAFIAQHSSKCADVLNKSQNNGAAVGQWECYWGNNQRWLLEGIE